jgi:hypothetical protein
VEYDATLAGFSQGYSLFGKGFDPKIVRAISNSATR